jgi:(p)ppGpp synthase/HD superfamily hydrolase
VRDDDYHVRLNELLDTLNKNDVHIEKLMKRSDVRDVSAARRIKILEQQQDNLYELIEKLQEDPASSDSSTL